MSPISSSLLRPLLASWIALSLPSADAQGSCSLSQMSQVFDNHFNDIGPGVAIWSGVPVPQSVCLDYKYGSLESDFQAFLQNSFAPVCEEGGGGNGTAVDPLVANTCRAIQATYDVFVELEQMGCSPVFRNYLPAWTNWYQNETACLPDAFDPATKTWYYENGCNGFALCDILNNVLTLAANQQKTGTCGPTASFTVVSHAGPVRALRLASELVWTGTTIYLKDHPCPFIYDFYPGVEPLMNPDQTLEEVCGPNPVPDCSNFYNNNIVPIQASGDYSSTPAFLQGPGTEFMFTQAFETAWWRNQHAGDCTPEVFQLIEPNLSNHLNISGYQGVGPDAIVYFIKGMVDSDYDAKDYPPSGPFAFPGITAMTQAGANYWMFDVFLKTTKKQQKQITAFFNGTSEDKIRDSTVRDLLAGVACSIDPAGNMTESVLEGQMSDFFTHSGSWPGYPSPTVSELNAFCSIAEQNEMGVVLALNSKILQAKLKGEPLSLYQLCINGTEPYCDGKATGLYPSPNHATVLKSCDIAKNEYNIWTWAQTVTLGREYLVASDDRSRFMGSIWDIIVGAPTSAIDQAMASIPPPPPNEPTPCDPGVCHFFCDSSASADNDLPW